MRKEFISEHPKAFRRKVNKNNKNNRVNFLKNVDTKVIPFVLTKRVVAISDLSFIYAKALNDCRLSLEDAVAYIDVLFESSESVIVTPRDRVEVNSVSIPDVQSEPEEALPVYEEILNFVFAEAPTAVTDFIPEKLRFDFRSAKRIVSVMNTIEPDYHEPHYLLGLIDGIEPNPGPPKKTKRNNLNPGKPRQNRRRRRNNQKIVNSNSLRGNFPFPESQQHWLRGQFNFTLQGAALFALHEFRINSLFDFDVTGGTANDFSGTIQLSAIYQSYFVESIRFRYTAEGNETAQGVCFGFTLKDGQPSLSITTLAKAVDSLEVFPATGPATVSQTSGQPIFRSRWFSTPLGKVLGNPRSYNSSIEYTGAFGANPAQSLWMAAVAYTNGASNITNGVIINLTVELRVRVYSLQTLMD